MKSTSPWLPPRRNSWSLIVILLSTRSFMCAFLCVIGPLPHILADSPICLSFSLFPVKIHSYSLFYACLSLWNGVFTKLFSLQPSESLSGGGLFLINSLGNFFSATVFRTSCGRIFWNVHLVNHQVWNSLLSPAYFSSFSYFVTSWVLSLSQSPVSSFSFPVPSTFK